MIKLVTLEQLLQFIAEDAPYGDITTESVIDEKDCRGVLVARQAGIIAGLEEAAQLFRHFGVHYISHVNDGEKVYEGTEIAALEGSAAGILLVERTALNIIGRMSGIATQTRNLSDLISSHNLSCRIAATRKTAPGLRSLDKKAVLLGGGEGHRLGLSDGILIKDNHLAIVSLEEAIKRAKIKNLYRKIEVEVENTGEALRAAHAGAEILLLDNMTPLEVRETIRCLDNENLINRLVIEVSGGINAQNILEYAIPGVDVISMGSITHSVSNFDISLEIIP